MKDQDYFIGLDIGTSSIGMAVTDTKYNILKHKGNAMWFVKLFDESTGATKRRGFRTSSRRTMRIRQRIDLLQTLFNEPIAQIDTAFFQRLSESNLYREDKTVQTPYAVFADPGFTDNDYHKMYPTIYHLRKELIENDAPHDVRLVYLAIHHLIKHRGHFLFDSLNTEEVGLFSNVFEQLKTYLYDQYSIELDCDAPEELGAVLKDRSKGSNQKHLACLKICGINKKQQPVESAVLALICGKQEKASVLFDEEILIEDKPVKIDLTGDYEKWASENSGVLGDRFELIEQLKAVYDWSVLADILGGETYISSAKVKCFNKHKSDLALLKKYVKQHCPQKYNEIFKVSKNNVHNYTAYSGMIKDKGKTGVLNCVCDQAKFCDHLKKLFKDLPHDGYETMFADIETKTFMPKQHISDNGVIPIQLNRTELELILHNAENYLPFLCSRDDSGLTVSEKIIKIFNFRIPYYVGPLNPHSDHAWLTRKEGKIYPWNFENMVDIDASAETFIKRMTSKCTYLHSEDVLTKDSVLYSKFCVLNELNNIRINGEKIDTHIKQSVFRDLFLTRKKVTKKGLEKYFRSLGYTDIELTGIDGDPKSSMRSYIELKDYGLTETEMDEIIKMIAIFGDDKKLLKKRLRTEFSEKLTDNAIGKISRLSYSGWGRLSHKFLCGIYDTDRETGEAISIIDALWKTNDNLMILLGSKYGFAKSIEQENSVDTEKSLTEIVDSLYVSPMVKRPIIQSVKMVKEIVKVMGRPPKKLFVEMTRADGKKGYRKESRKDQLIQLYKSCGKDSGELFEQLMGTENSSLRQDRLYLYFTQFGKCMYTNEDIVFSSLFDSNVYDIDHIYPRSKIKDDSLSNRVLVKKQVNASKDNVYPLPADTRQKMSSHWNFLLSKDLISKEKYKRLTRCEPLTDDELSDFIARQLVETSQSTKAVAEILSQMYPSSDIVYVKARNVTEFRKEHDLLKCRAVNDLHHAKDAYLNIVVGNVYDVLYTRNKANFIKGLQTKKYSLNKMFSFNIPNAWVNDNYESINIVKKTMNKNNIIFTRYSSCQHGTLFDIQPLKKGLGQVSLKGTGARSSIEKYGGYNKAASAYFTLVRCTGKKGKKSLRMQPVNLYQIGEFESDPIAFLQNKLGLCEPEILIKRVKYNACISIDGFRLHLSNKQGVSLGYKPAMQLVLGYKYEKYIRNITKYLDNAKDRKINKYDELTREENIELFDLLVDKMTSTILKVKFYDMGKKIESKRDTFIEIPIEKQCYVLDQVLNMLHCNAMSGDLRDIGLAGQAGTLKTQIDLSTVKGKMEIVYQSATGLFENKYIIK